MKRTNLRSTNIPRQRRRTEKYGTQTPLSSAAVERGSTRWLSGSYVSIEGILDVAGAFNVSGATVISGSLTIAGQTGITGPLTIQGVTDITGQLNVTGPTTLDGVLDIGGDTTITGALDITGDTSITGTLGIDGVTTLKNDLNVESGGRIKAGQVEIYPDDGGNIAFDSGGITSGGTGFRFTGTGGRNAVVESIGGRAILTGGTDSSVTSRAGAIDLTAPALNITGAIKAPGIETLGGRVKITNPYEGSQAPNVYMDANGYLHRTSWKP